MSSPLSFRQTVWTQELNKDQLTDGERHLSSDIELPEYSEEDDEDIEETEADKEEKDADYEDDEIHETEKSRKKKKGNKNRTSKKKDRNKWVFRCLSAFSKSNLQILKFGTLTVESTDQPAKGSNWIRFEN